MFKGIYDYNLSNQAILHMHPYHCELKFSILQIDAIRKELREVFNINPHTGYNIIFDYDLNYFLVTFREKEHYIAFKIGFSDESSLY